jgi:sugar lactone lactonase YvrE
MSEKVLRFYERQKMGIKDEITSLNGDVISGDKELIKGHVKITSKEHGVIVDKDNHIVITGRHWLMQRAMGRPYTPETNYHNWLPGFFSVGNGGCTIDAPTQPLTPTDEDIDMNNPLPFIEENQIQTGIYSEDLTKKKIISLEYITQLTARLKMEVGIDEASDQGLNEAGIFVSSLGSGTREFIHIPFEVGAKVRYAPEDLPFTIGGTFIESTGEIYITNVEDKSIMIFSASGEFARYIKPTEDIVFGTLGGIVVGVDGNIYVCDSEKHCIQVFTKTGYHVRTLGEYEVPGNNSSRFNQPVDIAVDEYGNLYIADKVNQRVVVYDASGYYMTSATTNITNPWGYLFYPDQIVLDSSHRWYITDKTQKMVVYGNRLGPQGLIGVPWVSEPKPDSAFRGVDCIALDTMDNLYVYDKSTSETSCRVFDPNLMEINPTVVPFAADLKHIKFGKDGNIYIFNELDLVKCTYRPLESTDFIMLSRVTFPTFIKSPMDSLVIEWYFIF